MAEPADAPPRLPHLPADIFMEILSRVGDAVTVVRCGATCKAWRRLILEPSFLSRCRAGPSLFLLGFFFRDTSPKRSRRRRYLGRPTRFLRIGRPHSVFQLSHFLPNAAGLSGFDAVASGGHGLLALRRVKGYSCDSIRICVCNPMAGTSTFLPPLPNIPFRDLESLEFLDADGSSFRLLASTNIYMEHAHPPEILLRVFSSQTGQWGMAVTAQLPDNMKVLYIPPVVHHGDIHWICYNRAHPFAVDAVLAVRPGQTEASACRIDLPLHAGINRHNAWRALRLYSSALGCLSLVSVDKPVISIWNHQDDGTGGKSWALHKTVYLMSDDFALWRPSVAALCDQSGSLFLTHADGGLFMVNLETGMMSKVCDAFCDKYQCPYMPDLRSCLGAMKYF
ncbi:hypothetical protein QYE76_000691 [Lolium multiflorum]|uniref:F-box domain-containing protein n=1 Tax=Lolium multiflorum TaxID=4521 RepID=A0AAD8RI21_LOLMU|nr:hypothetical protein QYE76_000691 [Lolium multiflorum]